MIDQNLLRLLGENKKYIYYTVGWMLLGLLANITITACICQAIALATQAGQAIHAYIYLSVFTLTALIVRYIASRKAGQLKDLVGRKAKKTLREGVYHQMVTLGVRSMDDMSMAGLTQVGIEGVEQLDLYYSSYIPQFFYAMIAPVILFLVTVFIDWKVALSLLICVPLIPLSIIAVSRYAKKIFAKYWQQYTSMGDFFLDCLQGLSELKIFQADARAHQKMNEQVKLFVR